MAIASILIGASPSFIIAPSVSAAMPSQQLKVRFEQLDLPALSALNAVKLDLASGPEVPVATIEAAIREWGKASQMEFSGLSRLPLNRGVKRDVAADRHWTSLLIGDLEAYHAGHFPKRTNGDLARHNAAAARVDHDFGVQQNG